MILVVGATGDLGIEICRRLTAKGKAVKAVTRPISNPTRVEELKKLGATLIQADLTDRASLDAACKGVTTVISTASACPVPHQPSDTIPVVDQAGQLSLVDAARAGGVSHYVYISYSRNINTDCPLTSAKRAVEQHLIESGMPYTILRPSFFMEVWLSPALGFDYPKASVQIYGTGQNKLSWISLFDVAQYAVDSLENPKARSAVIELGGPEALSPLQVVRIFEQETGQNFAVQNVPEAALHAQKEQATNPLQQSYAGLMIDVARGDVVDTALAFSLFPFKLKFVKDYAQRSVAVQ